MGFSLRIKFGTNHYSLRVSGIVNHHKRNLISNGERGKNIRFLKWRTQKYQYYLHNGMKNHLLRNSAIFSTLFRRFYHETIYRKRIARFYHYVIGKLLFISFYWLLCGTRNHFTTLYQRYNLHYTHNLMELHTSIQAHPQYSGRSASTRGVFRSFHHNFESSYSPEQ